MTKFTAMTRRKFTSSFKTKVFLEALKERKILADLTQEYELQPTQISAWKREFLEGTSSVLTKKNSLKKAIRSWRRNVF